MLRLLGETGKLEIVVGGGIMTVLDQVRGFIVRRFPQSICDDCIADRLGLSVRQHVNHKTRELSKLCGFDRRKGVCSLCGATKVVIRAEST